MRKEGLLTGAGEVHTLPLQLVDNFKPLVNQASGEPNFPEVKQLLDTSHRADFLPTCVAFHPCMSMLGKQPSLLVGTQGGSIAKLNSRHLRGAVIHKCCIPNAGGTALAVSPADPDLPAREYLIRHLARVVLLAAVGGGAQQVSVDSSGLVCLWRYAPDAFSTLGWFRPEAVALVDIADATLEDDPAVPPEELFPASPEERALRERGAAAWQELAGEYLAALAAEQQWGAPVLSEPWSEGRIRKRHGTTVAYEEADPDVEAGRATLHALRFDHAGVLLSHVATQRVRTVFKGSVLKAKVDHSESFVVLLGYLPPTRVSGARITLVRFHILSEALYAPKIELPLPDKFKKAIKAKPLEPPPHLDVDFDIAPPMGESSLQTVHLLLDNHVRAAAPRCERQGACGRGDAAWGGRCTLTGCRVEWS